MQAAWLSFTRPFSATLWRAAAEWICGQCVDLLTFESLLLHVSPCMGFYLPHINYAPDVPKFHYSTPRFLHKTVAIILLPLLSTTKTNHNSNDTQHTLALPSELIPISNTSLSLSFIPSFF